MLKKEMNNKLESQTIPNVLVPNNSKTIVFHEDFLKKFTLCYLHRIFTLPSLSHMLMLLYLSFPSSFFKIKICELLFYLHIIHDTVPFGDAAPNFEKKIDEYKQKLYNINTKNKQKFC